MPPSSLTDRERKSLFALRNSAYRPRPVLIHEPRRARYYEYAVRGTKCRKANKLRDEALKALREKPAKRTVNSMAVPISAVLRFASVEEVSSIIHCICRFLCNSAGPNARIRVAPVQIELGRARRKKGNRKAKRTRKSNADYQRD